LNLQQVSEENAARILALSRSIWALQFGELRLFSASLDRFVPHTQIVNLRIVGHLD